jgi:hypothetical protein
MSCSRRICAVTLIAIVSACSAQTAQHKQKPDPKPDPTPQELIEYIRGSLLAYSPEDRINDNLEVTVDAAGTVLTVKQPDGHCDQFLNALNANTLVWDIFDASDPVTTRQQILRLTIVSVSGKSARTCYDKWGRVDGNLATNRARFMFALGKIGDPATFQTKMTKAFKMLIAASGGAPEKDIF